MKTKNELPFIVYTFACVSLLSFLVSLTLPAQAASHRSELDREFGRYIQKHTVTANQNGGEQYQLTPFNSARWRSFAQSPLDFSDNIDAKHEKPGQQIRFYSNNVTLSHDFDGIADIAANGTLYLARETLYGSTSVLVKGSESGYVGYHYKVDGKEVVDQWAAQGFIEQILKDTVGEGVHRWQVNQLKAMAHRPNRTKTDARKITGNRLLNALLNEDQFFSPADLEIVQAMLQSPHLLRKRAKSLMLEDSDDGPFFLGVASSGAHRADIHEDGSLSFNFTSEDGIRESTRYQLNNDSLYSLFLEITGQEYMPGKTEEAMVDFFVRLHFKRPDNEIRWIRE